MPIILSIAQSKDTLWAAGPEGLFTWRNNELQPVPQPQQELACCGIEGNRVLVGGRPFGVAYSLDAGTNWQASWVDEVDSSVLCIAPDPNIEKSGIILAGSMGGGVLRTHNRGHSWLVSNFGIQDYMVLSIAWAPPMADDIWPRWEVVFAATEQGIYRSPNAGRGWQQCEQATGVFQALSISPNFHSDGIVLAGAEDSGLWRSDDGGRTFAQVPDTPQRIDAITATPDGWLLSDESGLWRSTDGLQWSLIPDSQPALTFLSTAEGIWCGGEHGMAQLFPSAFSPISV